MGGQFKKKYQNLVFSKSWKKSKKNHQQLRKLAVEMMQFRTKIFQALKKVQPWEAEGAWIEQPSKIHIFNCVMFLSIKFPLTKFLRTSAYEKCLFNEEYLQLVKNNLLIPAFKLERKGSLSNNRIKPIRLAVVTNAFPIFVLLLKRLCCCVLTKKTLRTSCNPKKYICQL